MFHIGPMPQREAESARTAASDIIVTMKHASYTFVAIVTKSRMATSNRL